MIKRIFIVLIVIIIFIVSIGLFIEVKIERIKPEGYRIVKLIEDYKIKNRKYPASLEELKIRLTNSFRYSYNKKNDGYTLTYYIFTFYRLHYRSKEKKWLFLLVI